MITAKEARSHTDERRVAESAIPSIEKQIRECCNKGNAGIYWDGLTDFEIDHLKNAGFSVEVAKRQTPTKRGDEKRTNYKISW